MKKLKYEYIMSDREGKEIKISNLLLSTLIYMTAWNLTGKLGNLEGSGDFEWISVKIIIMMLFTVVYILRVLVPIVDMVYSKSDLKKIENVLDFDEDLGFKKMENVKYLRGREDISRKDRKYIRSVNEYYRKKIENRVELNKGDLSERDVGVTVDILKETGSKIDTIQEVVRSSKGLMEIENNENIVKLLEEFQESIVQEPYRLIEVSKFLNNYVPQLEQLVLSYREVEVLEYKKEDTKSVMEDSEQAIIKLVKAIEEEYQEFKDLEVRKLEAKVNEILSS